MIKNSSTREPARLMSLEALTERQTAQMLNCSAAALRKWRREGQGPRWVRCGRLIRYPADWLREFLATNAVGPEDGLKYLKAHTVEPRQ
jgi:hypothetical protein